MTIGDLPVLETQGRVQLQSALRAWAREHPNPFKPVIGFAGSRMLSPLQLSAAFEEQTEDGQAFEVLVRLGMQRVPLEGIIAQLRSEALG